MTFFFTTLVAGELADGAELADALTRVTLAGLAFLTVFFTTLAGESADGAELADALARFALAGVAFFTVFVTLAGELAEGRT